MKQLAVLIVFMFLSLALTVSTPETPSSQELPTRPNIVVVMTDDQEARSVRYMSQVKHRLGARGTSFANFFASQPLCCPDRATFLTGLYPHNHGIHNNDGSRFWRAGLDHSTVATWLKGSGYKTAYFGKYLNHYWPPHEGTTRPQPGWDRWYAYASGYDTNPLPVIDQDHLTYFDKIDEHEADHLAAKATGYIEQNAAAQGPFFMVVATHTPHLPADVAPRHRGRYSGLALPRPPSFNERDVSDKPTVIKRKPRLTAAGVRVLAAQHRKRMESLLAVDDLVGALLDKLAAQGELRNTYFVFTSDNGWYSGEHRLTAKSFPYEEGASIPLIVRGPGVPSGVSVPHLVGMHDMAPTIAAIGGTRPSRVVDGKSFKPLLSAERPAPGSWRKALLIENVDDKARYWAVRQQTRLYAEHRETRTLEREHYNLLKDPYQLRSTHYSLSQGMRDRLHDKLVKLRACDGRECRAAEGR